MIYDEEDPESFDEEELNSRLYSEELDEDEDIY